jgi:hypothetical protein
MFYTYMWLRKDGTPYYIGKGFGRRAYDRWSHIQNPPPMDRMVFYVAKDEAEAFENEVALIWYYGRKDLGTGCLRNLTDGGEGAAGIKQTEATKKKRSAALTGKPCPSRGRFGKRPPELGRKISASKMGHTTSKETRQKMAEAKLGKRGNHTGHTHSEETRRRISVKKKGKPGPNKGRVFSVESRLRMSASAKKRGNNFRKKAL